MHRHNNLRDWHAKQRLCTCHKQQAQASRYICQVLKKKQLKEQEQVENAVYVMQNQRAQLYYTEADRPLMETAWERMDHKDMNQKLPRKHCGKQEIQEEKRIRLVVIAAEVGYCS